MGMTLQERETLLNDLDICTRLGGCAGCSRLGGEGIAYAQDLMARVRETIRSAPAWIPAENEPKMGDPFLMEPDLAVQESDPVLILSDGEYDLGQWVIESDPGDPSYRAEYWANMGGSRVRVEWWAELPKKPKGGK